MDTTPENDNQSNPEKKWLYGTQPQLIHLGHHSCTQGSENITETFTESYDSQNTEHKGPWGAQIYVYIMHI